MEDFSDLVEDEVPQPQSLDSEDFSDLVEDTPKTMMDDNFNPITLGIKGVKAAANAFPTGPVRSGIEAGLITLKGLYGDVLPAIGNKIIGDTEGQQRQIQEYTQKQKLIQDAYAPPHESLTKAYAEGEGALDTAGNVWEQAKYEIAMGLASNVPAIAAMVVTGGLTAPAVVGGDAAISLATNNLLKTYTKRYASKAALTAGAGVVASEPQMVASSYIDRLQETGVDSPTTAVIAGTLANGLQTLPYMQIAKNLIPKPLQKDVTNEVAKIVLERLTLKQLPKGILSSSVTGAAATAAGTLTNQIATKIVNDAPYELFSQQNVDHLIDSALSGGVTMGAIHGLTSLPGSFKGSMDKYAPDTDYTNADVAKNSSPVISEALPSPEGSPQQPLPVRPSRKAHTGPDGVVNEEAYKAARGTYENYFQERFGKGPEQYYKERKALEPEDTPDIKPVRETPEESAEALEKVIPKQEIPREETLGPQPKEAAPEGPVPFDPDAVQRNIVNAEPHLNLKLNNFAIPKALDRITQEVAGLEDFKYFQTLAEDPTAMTPQVKANILNMMRTGMDLVKGQASRTFTSDPTSLTEFYHHATDSQSPYLKPSDKTALEKAMPMMRKKVAEKLGLDVRDVITNYPDSVVAAQAFHDFMQNRYEGRPPESYGGATPTFNKLGNLLYRQGQVLNANKIGGVDTLANKLTQEQLNDSLYAMAQKRNEEWLGQRVGATIDEAKAVTSTDKDFTDLANIKDPENIKHISRADNYLGTAMLMATKYPWMSDTIQHFNNKIDRVAQISKQIGTVPRQILSKNKNNFSMIHDILDSGRMNNTSAKVSGPEGSKVLRFKWGGGERVIQDQAFIEQFEAIRNNYKATLSEDEGDFRRYLNKNYGLPESSTPKDIKEHSTRLQEYVDAAGKDDPTANTALTQIQELNDIAAALGNMKKMQGVDYVPHLRFGKLAVMAFKKSREEGVADELVFMDGLEEGYKGKVNSLQEKEVNQKLAKYRNNPEYYILGDQPNNRMRLTQNDVLKKIPPQHVSMELIYSMFGDQSKESAQAMQELIQGKINKSKLAFYMKPSSNIDGYSKDWPRALETWVHARSLNQSNKESDAELSKVLDHVQNLEKNGAYYKPDDPGYTNPGDIQWLKDYIEYNRDRGSDLMLLRNLNFLQAMGGRFKTAVMQTLNGPQMMVPLLTVGGGNWMRLQGNWANNLRKSAQIVSKSWGHEGQQLNVDNVWKQIESQKLLTTEQLQLAKTFAKSHLLDQTILDDNAGTSYESRDSSGQFKKQLQLVSQLLGSHIGEAEKMSRLASILTVAKEISNPETFRRLKNAYEPDPGWIAFRDSVTGRKKGAYTEKEALAMYMMEQAHGRYGKSGRGRVQRGLSAALFFPFSTQMLTQWELMKNMASSKGTAGKIASMYMLGSFMTMAGLTSLPGYATLKAGYNLYDGMEANLNDIPEPAKDFDIDLRKWLEKALGPDWANIVQKGPLRHLLGVDVSNTTTLPTSFETIASKPLEVLAGITRGKAPDLTQMVGPALSPINTVAAAVKSKSAVPAMPPVVRDLVEAAKGMDPDNPQGGIRTMTGTIIQPSKDPETGEPSYNTAQRVARGLGFIPTEESQQKDAFHESKFVDEANKMRAGVIVKRAISAQVNMLSAKKLGKTGLADSYYNQVNDLREAWINFQKQAGSANINIDSFNNSVIKGAMQYQQGWQPRTVKGRVERDDIKNRAILGYESDEEEQPTSDEDFSDLVE